MGSSGTASGDPPSRGVAAGRGAEDANPPVLTLPVQGSPSGVEACRRRRMARRTNPGLRTTMRSVVAFAETKIGAYPTVLRADARRSAASPPATGRSPARDGACASLRSPATERAAAGPRRPAGRRPRARRRRRASPASARGRWRTSRLRRETASSSEKRSSIRPGPAPGSRGARALAVQHAEPVAALRQGQAGGLAQGAETGAGGVLRARGRPATRRGRALWDGRARARRRRRRGSPAGRRRRGRAGGAWRDVR